MVSERVKKLTIPSEPKGDSYNIYIMTTHNIYAFENKIKRREYSIKDAGAIV